MRIVFVMVCYNIESQLQHDSEQIARQRNLLDLLNVYTWCKMQYFAKEKQNSGQSFSLYEKRRDTVVETHCLTAYKVKIMQDMQNGIMGNTHDS